MVDISWASAGRVTEQSPKTWRRLGASACLGRLGPITSGTVLVPLKLAAVFGRSLQLEVWGRCTDAAHLHP
jgi:hypothetical protein